jgi:hypothetical protein
MSAQTTDERANQCIDRLLDLLESDPSPQDVESWERLHDRLADCLAATSKHVRSERVQKAVDDDWKASGRTHHGRI